MAEARRLGRGEGAHSIYEELEKKVGYGGGQEEARRATSRGRGGQSLGPTPSRSKRRRSSSLGHPV